MVASLCIYFHVIRYIVPFYACVAGVILYAAAVSVVLLTYNSACYYCWLLMRENVHGGPES